MSHVRITKILKELAVAPRYPFRDWREYRLDIPTEAGIYTIWKGRQLLFAGIAGTGKKHRGLRERLKQHCDGQRGSDKFSIHVFDRFVLPSLTKAAIRSAVAGKLSLDDQTAEFIQDELAFTYRQCSAPLALQAENEIRQGNWKFGPPFLNPIESSE